MQRKVQLKSGIINNKIKLRIRWGDNKRGKKI